MGDDDRISELYHREIFDWDMQERSRARIHWICQQVAGERVLDLGCSQGIVSLLLAREGFQVVGVDQDQGQIDFARERLTEEPAAVQERARFEVGDAGGLPFEAERFDTVLAGELLEHLTHPGRALEEIVRVLVPGGRVVVTVPFGLHPHPDHKQTFYLTSLVEQVGQHLNVRSLDVVDKYILLVAELPGQAGPEPYGRTVELLRMTEKVLDEIELAYHASIDAKQRRSRGLRAKAEKAADQRRDSEARLAKAAATADRMELALETAERESAGLEAEHGKLAERLEGLEREVARLQETLAQDQVELQDGQRALASAQAEERELKSALTTARRQAREADAEAARVRKSIETCRQDIEGLSAERQRVSRLLDRAGVERGSPAWRLERLVSHYARMKKSLDNTSASLRFRVGDAFVDAAKPSLATAVLPFRLAGLAAEGAQTWWQRRRRTDAKGKPARKQVTAQAPERKAQASAQVPADAERWSMALADQDRPERAAEVKVAAVLDEFSTDCFAPECRLIRPRPDNWEARLRFEHPHLLFVESAWKGNGGGWQYRVATYEAPPGQELAELTDFCRKHSLPSVFWNKEDPVHYEKFLQAARRFDIVLTTDADCIERYRQALGNSRVAALPFAAQPRLQNPIALPEGRNDRICFAGSYYANRHEDRRREMEMLLDAAAGQALDIYDRNHGTTGPGAEHFRFPDRFQRHIVGRLPYRELMRAYRLYRVFLNVNSVIDSPTMFSRRVFELMACGTPVVSTRSAGVENLLGDDVVWIVKDQAGAREAVRTLLEDDAEWRRRSLHGVRRVMAEHTYAHRFAAVLEHAGIQVQDSDDPFVVLVAEADSERAVTNVIEAFERQGWPRKKLLMHARSDRPSVIAPDVELFAGEDAAAALVARLEELGPALVGRLDADCAYGRHYLLDLIHAWRYSGADVVGKHPGGEDPFCFNTPLHAAGSLYDWSAMIGLGWQPGFLFGAQTADWAAAGARTFTCDGAEFRAGIARSDDSAAMARAVADCEI